MATLATVLHTLHKLALRRPHITFVIIIVIIISEFQKCSIKIQEAQSRVIKSSVCIHWSFALGTERQQTGQSQQRFNHDYSR